jgi:hypothetical protein
VVGADGGRDGQVGEWGGFTAAQKAFLEYNRNAILLMERTWTARHSAGRPERTPIPMGNTPARTIQNVEFGEADRTRASLMLSIIDGTRRPVSPGREYQIRIIDGQHKQVYKGRHSEPHCYLRMPFSDGPSNRNAVVISAKGCWDSGFYPVVLDPGKVVAASIMLLSRKGTFSFAEAMWSTLRRTRSDTLSLLRSGAGSDAEARDRYELLLDERPLHAACLWNILTAAELIPLRRGSVASSLRRLIWDRSMAQDRVFAFADENLVREVTEAAGHGQFKEEVGPVARFFHKGATRSFKQMQFSEANLQITFHEGSREVVDGTACVKVELDMDYFKDVGSHAALEVLPNAIQRAIRGESHGKTNPRDIYKMRWMASRNSIGAPEFEPPYRFA